MQNQHVIRLLDVDSVAVFAHVDKTREDFNTTTGKALGTGAGLGAIGGGAIGFLALAPIGLGPFGAGAGAVLGGSLGGVVGGTIGGSSREIKRHGKGTEQWFSGVAFHLCCPSIALVIDTSWLMKVTDEGRSLFSCLNNVLPRLFDEDCSHYITPHLTFKPFSVSVFLPSEVLDELVTHAKAPDHDKRKLAAMARLVRNRIRENCTRPHSDEVIPYAEPRLCDVVTQLSTGDKLGVDSPTDKLLLSYGCKLLEQFDAVILLTSDGGFSAETHHLRNNGHNIFALAPGNGRDCPDTTSWDTFVARWFSRGAKALIFGHDYYQVMDDSLDIEAVIDRCYAVANKAANARWEGSRGNEFQMEGLGRLTWQRS